MIAEAEPTQDGKPQKKIPFDRWVAVGQKEAGMLIKGIRRRDELSADLRLFALAMSRMNNGGHAEFQPGELSLMMATVDKKTGEILPMNRSQIFRLKRKLANAGFLVNASGGVTCVWVNAGAVWAGRQNGYWRCKTHKTAGRWPEDKAQSVACDATGVLHAVQR